MTFESLMFILAPLFLFVLGVLIIPQIVKPKNMKLDDSYKLINDLEKKYIYKL